MFIFYSFRYQYVKQLFKNELSRKGGGGGIHMCVKAAIIQNITEAFRPDRIELKELSLCNKL